MVHIAFEIFNAVFKQIEVHTRYQTKLNAANFSRDIFFAVSSDKSHEDVQKMSSILKNCRKN